MSKTKFTKGEWNVFIDEYESVEVRCGHRMVAAYTQIANAHLIAQSPNLYKALEDTTEELAKLIEMYNEEVGDPFRFADGQTCHENAILLAKARGEECSTKS